MDYSLVGLNKYEGAAYEALIQFGRLTASELSKHSGVPQGKIYDVMSALEFKGFCRKITGEVKSFVPVDPQEVDNILEQKQKEFTKLKTHMKTLKKTYEQLQSSVVQIVEGKRNFYKTIEEMSAPNKTYSYSIKYTSEYRPEFIRHTKNDLKKSINVKTLVRYDAETKKDVLKWSKISPFYKKIKNTGIAMHLNDEYMWISLIKNNTLVVFKDPHLINVMKQLFEAYYEDAKSIT